jgi:hypothetical protein
MIYLTPRIHRDPDGMLILTVGMRISVALHSCLSLSLLIAMFRMMGSDRTSSLREKPRLLASFAALLSIA